MPRRKSEFPMTYWKREDSVITVGGHDGWNLNEVQQFSRFNNEWQTLPSLPEKVRFSAATVLGDVFYNMGGGGSSQSVVWLDLVSVIRTWSSLKKLGAATSFRNYFFSDATVVKKKIVYFGS